MNTMVLEDIRWIWGDRHWSALLKGSVAENVLTEVQDFIASSIELHVECIHLHRTWVFILWLRKQSVINWCEMLTYQLICFIQTTMIIILITTIITPIFINILLGIQFFYDNLLYHCFVSYEFVIGHFEWTVISLCSSWVATPLRRPPVSISHQ